MNLTIPKTEVDEILREIYTILQDQEEFKKSDREKLEAKLKKAIDLRWEDSNLFESYFTELNEVLGAMSRMDFTKRMSETDDPNSLLNLISVSFNRINDRLEENYVGLEFIPELMESVKIENRIVLVSSDKQTIDRAFCNIEGLDLNIKGLVKQPVSWLVKEGVLDFMIEDEDSFYEYSGELAPDLFPTLDNRKAHFSVKNGKNYLVATITVYPDNVIELNKNRILNLLRQLNIHFEKNPEAVKSISGYVHALDLKNLVDELLPYIDKKFPPQEKPTE